MDTNLTCNADVEHIAVPLAWFDKVHDLLVRAAGGNDIARIAELLQAEARFLRDESDIDVATCSFDGDVEVNPTQRRDVGVAECPLCGTEHTVEKADFDTRN